jgi:pimeloyl-ACP methyl ester carboxylesterase
MKIQSHDPFINLKKLFQVSAVFTSGTLLTFLAINFGLAWLFLSRLIRPDCLEPHNLSVERKPAEYWVETTDGLSLRIWYYASQNGAVILSFGGLNGSLGSNIPQIDFLIQEGYGIVQVDTRACAHPSANVTLGANELYDAEAALNFVLALDEIHPKRIGAIGFSMGGATAIRLAARHLEVQAVVRDGGYADLGKMLFPRDQTGVLGRFFQHSLYWLFRLRTGVNPQNVSPINDLLIIKSRPILLIYGEAEAQHGIDQYRVLGKANTLWIVPGSTHGRNHLVAPIEYQKQVLSFFNHALLE